MPSGNSIGFSIRLGTDAGRPFPLLLVVLSLGLDLDLVVVLRVGITRSSATHCLAWMTLQGQSDGPGETSGSGPSRLDTRTFEAQTP